MKKKILRVKDPSQPIKIAIFLAFFVAVGVLIYFFAMPTATRVMELLEIIAANTAR